MASGLPWRFMCEDIVPRRRSHTAAGENRVPGSSWVGTADPLVTPLVRRLEPWFLQEPLEQLHTELEGPVSGT